MVEMLAFCGIRCDQCDTFQATQTNDDARRRQIAERWSKQFKADFRPEQMNCTGCRSASGPVFFYCSMCAVRKCARERGVPTCAHCDDYGCSTLQQFWQVSPENRHLLDAVRKELQQ